LAGGGEESGVDGVEPDLGAGGDEGGEGHGRLLEMKNSEGRMQNDGGVRPMVKVSDSCTVLENCMPLKGLAAQREKVSGRRGR
jgi:hypothetical protein